MCMCNFAYKGRPRNDLCGVGQDVKPYSITHSLALTFAHHNIEDKLMPPLLFVVHILLCQLYLY